MTEEGLEKVLKEFTEHTGVRASIFRGAGVSLESHVVISCVWSLPLNVPGVHQLEVTYAVTLYPEEYQRASVLLLNAANRVKVTLRQ